MTNFRSDFERLALPNRSNILAEYTFRNDDRHSITKAESAGALMSFAIQEGLIDRPSSIYGDTLRAWCDNNTGPLWACKAALLLLIKDGWEPRSNTEWAIFSYLFIRIHEDKTLTELIPLAPNSYDVLTLSGWLCAALESKENYKGRKNVTT